MQSNTFKTDLCLGESRKWSAPGLFISPLLPSWLLCSWGMKLLHVWARAWSKASIHATVLACSCILTRGKTPAGSPLLTLLPSPSFSFSPSTFFSSPPFTPPSIHMPNHLYIKSLIASVAVALSARQTIIWFSECIHMYAMCQTCAKNFLCQVKTGLAFKRGTV